ncbi:MAG: hypothetical protein ACI8RZ_002218 [Myxococcota bacterium]|jgi:hypothetical protein
MAAPPGSTRARTSLLRRRQRRRGAWGDEQGAADALQRALQQEHPHALILLARQTGRPEDRRRAEDALRAHPGVLLSAELTDAHAYREDTPPVPPRHLMDPVGMTVERDMDGMQYRVSTWEKLAPLVRGVRWSVLMAVLSGVGMLAATGAGWSSEGLTGAVMILLQTGIIGGVVLAILGVAAFLLLVVLGRRWMRAEISIDRSGMRIQTPKRVEKILWAECADLRRRGRLIEVLRGGDWVALPSPNGVSDAQWLEALIREGIRESDDEPDAIPQNIAAALSALQQRQ